MNLLKDKVCIITGSARGIGRSCAELFAKEGASVIVNDVREGSADEWILQSPFKDRLMAAYFDITNRDSVQANVLKIQRNFGHIDVLVNNAGVEFNELIGMISAANMEKMFQVNVFGMIEMIQAVSRIMGRNPEGGSMINISSMAGLRGSAGQLVYSATKGAVIALTRSAAKELARKKIRVNSIAPGLTQTSMMEQASPEKLLPRIENICLGRVAQPEDIAKACLFLASDHASYISGQVLPVDGCTIM